MLDLASAGKEHWKKYKALFCMLFAPAFVLLHIALLYLFVSHPENLVMGHIT